MFGFIQYPNLCWITFLWYKCCCLGNLRLFHCWIYMNPNIAKLIIFINWENEDLGGNSTTGITMTKIHSVQSLCRERNSSVWKIVSASLRVNYNSSELKKKKTIFLFLSYSYFYLSLFMIRVSDRNLLCRISSVQLTLENQ